MNPEQDRHGESTAPHPHGKATMDQPQEEFIADSSVPSKSATPSPQEKRTEASPNANDE